MLYSSESQLTHVISGSFYQDFEWNGTFIPIQDVKAVLTGSSAIDVHLFATVTNCLTALSKQKEQTLSNYSC